MNRGPSAFAPSRLPGGRTLKWESLANTAGQVWNTFFTNTEPGTSRARVLLPLDILGGVTTVERIRGWVWFHIPNTVIDASATDLGMNVSMQLCPIQNATLVTQAILNDTNAADKENNRFLGFWNIFPTGWNSIPLTMDAVAGQAVTLEIDVKVRRRFDRSVWTLLLTTSAINVGIGTVTVAAELRALFSGTQNF